MCTKIYSYKLNIFEGLSQACLCTVTDHQPFDIWKLPLNIAWQDLQLLNLFLKVFNLLTLHLKLLCILSYCIQQLLISSLHLNDYFLLLFYLLETLFHVLHVSSTLDPFSLLIVIFDYFLDQQMLLVHNLVKACFLVFNDCFHQITLSFFTNCIFWLHIINN